jgi:MFS family permease
MKLRPYHSLTDNQVQSGLQDIVKEGLAAEAMATFTGGTFLVAMAVYMGASNFQIGLMAALPALTNVFQVASIWLVQKYNNRRAICVICSICARLPLFAIAFLPFMFTGATSLYVLIFLLFTQYIFGSVSGASWHSWMKDLVPERKLGSYFSQRSRLIQIVNVTLSLAIAISIDFVKSHYPQHIIITYTIMFFAGGIIGMIGVYLLSRAPEPKTCLNSDNVFSLLQRPLKNKNFKKLLIFQSFWAFATNLALPFFVVFMMKTLELPMSNIIALGILSQLSSIFSLKLWGKYTDRFSNKTIISICAPVFIACILSWSFTANKSMPLLSLVLLVIIHVVSGCSAAGINLAINNFATKLAPKNEAIVYISARNIIVSSISAIAPLVGGLMADFFDTHELSWVIEWKGISGISKIPLFHLQGWTFFFVIGSLLALFALRFLKDIRENGEIQKHRVMFYIRGTFERSLRRSLTDRALSFRTNNSVRILAFKRIIVKSVLSEEKKRA